MILVIFKIVMCIVAFALELITFRRITKVNLFIISFQPLFLILAIKFIFEKIENVKGKSISFDSVWKSFCFLLSNNWYMVLLYFSIMPLVVFICICLLAKKRKPLRVKKYDKLGENLVSYVMTYIVPLTTLSVCSKFSDFLGNIILFLIIMILYIRLDLTYLNPVLILLGFNIFKIHLEKMNGDEYDEDVVNYIITKKSETKFDNFLNSNSSIIHVNTLGNDLVLEDEV